MALENTKGSWTLPMVYEEMDPNDPASPVQFKYITDFTYSDADFSITSVDEGIENVNKLGEVSQNYTNQKASYGIKDPGPLKM